ncbi:ion transporter [Rhodobacteraceae bacterium WD3A24]|nr:ion transporter [Rhodobacteraceae bacterium WD3A24]
MITAATILIAVALLGGTVLMHDAVLHWAGGAVMEARMRQRRRVLLVIFACLGAHVIEIALYAAAFAAMHALPAFGHLSGMIDHSPLDYFYFSASSFTTVGYGDIHPEGPLRIVAGLESLNGFILITWSASFTYLMMRRSWHPGDDW